VRVVPKVNNLMVGRAAEVLHKYPDVVGRVCQLAVPEGIGAAERTAWVAGALLFDAMAGSRGEVSGMGCFRMRVLNPAVPFTKKAKAGEYDRLSDEEYDAKLRTTETMSALWMDNDYVSISALFGNMVGTMSDEDLDGLRVALDVSN